jgi:putative DNA primase/helicase
MGNTNQTDFNDLHQAEGLEVVREQIYAALEQPEYAEPVQDSPAPSLDEAPPWSDEAVADLPRAPSNVAPLSIEQVKERFALALPSGKVWDAHEKKLLKGSTAKQIIGKKLYAEWYDSGDKRTVQESDVQNKAAAAEAQGGGEIGRILNRYVYLYPTDGVWDIDRREIVPISSLKLAIAKYFDEWLKSPARQQIDRENLVFDPTQQCNPDTHINMFRGLAIKPEGEEERCGSVLKLILNLCNGELDVFAWLVKWLAYPLQNIGAKMATAVMMHSETQGTGKSLVFGGYMTRIYGEYSATLSQHQLESQYTDWRSQMLYGLFEEIFSRDQKYSHTGTIKHMVTGETQRIEKKFVSGWEEANHMNAVFLSNEIQPFHVEPSDRRMLVIWPEKTPPVELVEQAVTDLQNGGAAAFYNWLLKQNLSDFGPHTKPPMTEAKERLIDFGRPGWDTFYREWSRGCLEVPYVSCLTGDLYKYFKQWCGPAGERDMSRNKFTGFIGSRLRVRRDLHYSVGTSNKKGNFFIVGKPEEGLSQGKWLGKCVEQFQKALEKTAQ